MVLTTKPLEDVVQGHSNQVKDLIEAQKCTIQNSSQYGIAGLGSAWNLFVRMPWKTSSFGFVVNTL